MMAPKFARSPLRPNPFLKYALSIFNVSHQSKEVKERWAPLVTQLESRTEPIF
jgi:hypothetical protein